MAVREIVKYPSPILEKKCKEVVEFDEKLVKLLDDMYDTMIEADGVGIAAPQIGENVQVAIVDMGDGQEVIELINPVVTATGGSEIDVEGCLSFPDLFGEVERPYYVKVEAQERDGSIYEIEAEDFTARAILHEIDHLNGILFNSKMIRIVDLEDLEVEDELTTEREGEEV
ncbi:peptide deformylase [Sporosarcina ureilytica]|uniref:Peptide deformylase n=1 Tax=Sporosarcina ureilytica TaxID=298596 RepID=A0A1D8JHX5_9BACL|nr:peptide deformylase [Sporosarcina ureilytica]AOV08311.1 peptide deformylase [Sporosarcina ureilytica]